MPTPAPAPGGLLDEPSGGGGMEGCVAAQLLLPYAGPAMAGAAAGMLRLCGSSQGEYCNEVISNATYVSLAWWAGWIAGGTTGVA